MIPDSELLARYVATNDQKAFEEIVHRHLPLVYAAALRQLNQDSHGAQDVVQSVFTDLAIKAPGLVRHPVLAGWLHTASRYASAKFIRQQTRWRQREQESYAMKDISTNVEEPAEWDQVAPVLDDVLSALKERERDAVLLRYFEGKALAEVGTALGMSETAARSCIDRSIDKMRARLRRRGLYSSSSALAAMLGQQPAVAAEAGMAGIVAKAAMASAGSIPAAGFLITLMNTTKISVALGMVAVAGIGFGLYQTDRVGQLQAELNKTTELHRAEARPATTSPARPGAKSPSPPATDGKSVAAATTKGHGLPYAEYRQLQKKRSEQLVRADFGPFYARMGFKPDEIERLVAAETESMARHQDVGEAVRAMRAKGETIPTSFVWDQNRQINEEGLKNMHERLGDEGYSAYLAYAATLQFRATARDLATQLFYTDQPLTAAQADGLVALLALTTQRRGNGYDITTTDWASTLARANEVLSPAQVAALQTLHADAEVNQKWQAFIKGL